ncbi:MAG: hypothetical protein FWH12_02410 [Treponema sp.]|nr:hypothetical protein [Treponema sp.]
MTEAEFAEVRKIRMMLRDPIEVNDIIYANSLPVEPDAQVAYYVDSLGVYQKFNHRRGVWELLILRLSDAYIKETVAEKGVQRGAIALIDFIIMGLQSGAVSFSAGAESVTRASLADEIALLKEKKAILMEETGAGTGRTLRTRRSAIGGVMELM